MKHASLLFFVALLGFQSETFAQGALEKCGTVKDDKARLTCYDQARAATTPSAAAAGYTDIELVELKVDAKKLIGRRVSTQALIQVMGDTALLKSDEVDMTPVWANFENLPRDDRKKLANGCQMLLCKGQFFGTMSKGMMGATLNLERVVWR